MVADQGRSADGPCGDGVLRALHRATSALVGAEDAAEAERRTCTLLADAAPYHFAWIGERDPETGAAVARTVSEGADADPTAADAAIGTEAAIGELLARADRTGEVAVREPDAAGSGPGSAEGSDCTSLAAAAIPLVHDLDRDSDHGGGARGALVLYAAPDRADAFGADERALLADFGRNLARTLTDADAREQLREEKELLDAVFEHAPVHLYVKDEAARIVRVSGHYVDDPESQIGKTDLQLYEPGLAKHSYADDVQVIEEGEPVQNRIEYAPVQDEWNRTSKVPWRGPAGEIRGLVGATWKVTERKRYEQELERQNERLENVAGALGHDLRNPLMIATATVESLRRDLAEDADARIAADGPERSAALDRLATTADALSRMDSLVEDVLALAREGRAVEDADRQRLSLEAAAGEAWGMTDTRGAACRFGDGLGSVEADPDRLYRLFANLFRNCVEHGSTSSRAEPDDSAEHGSAGSRSQTDDSVEHGSTSSRAASGDRFPPLTVEVGPLEGEAGFYVADDGAGFPDGERERVFDREYSTGGTGFGLAIVRAVAEAHGWAVTAAESDAGGARVEIRTDPEDAADPPTDADASRSRTRAED